MRDAGRWIALQLIGCGILLALILGVLSIGAIGCALMGVPAGECGR